MRILEISHIGSMSSGLRDDEFQLLKYLPDRKRWLVHERQNFISWMELIYLRNVSLKFCWMFQFLRNCKWELQFLCGETDPPLSLADRNLVVGRGLGWWVLLIIWKSRALFISLFISLLFLAVNDAAGGRFVVLVVVSSSAPPFAASLSKSWDLICVEESHYAGPSDKLNKE